MICKKCKFENVNSAKFCEQCGSKLKRKKTIVIMTFLTIFILISLITTYLLLYQYGNLNLTHDDVEIEEVYIDPYENCLKVRCSFSELNNILCGLYPYTYDTCFIYEAGLLHDLDKNTFELNPGYDSYRPLRGYWYQDNIDSWCFQVAYCNESYGSPIDNTYCFLMNDLKDNQIYNICTLSRNDLCQNNYFDIMPYESFNNNYYRYTDNRFIKVNENDLTIEDVILETKDGKTYPVKYDEPNNLYNVFD